MQLRFSNAHQAFNQFRRAVVRKENPKPEFMKPGAIDAFVKVVKPGIDRSKLAESLELFQEPFSSSAATKCISPIKGDIADKTVKKTQVITSPAPPLLKTQWPYGLHHLMRVFPCRDEVNNFSSQGNKFSYSTRIIRRTYKPDTWIEERRLRGFIILAYLQSVLKGRMSPMSSSVAWVLTLLILTSTK